MLSIITGRFRGKRLALPPAPLTRPTSNRTREAVFNCLFSLDVQIQGNSVLDGFAGSGAMGLEALSRGAAFCSFVENNPTVLKVLQENITACRLERHEYEVRKDFGALCRAYDLIYLDPPYGLMVEGKPAYNHVLKELIANNLLKEGCIVMIETDTKLAIEPPPSLTPLFEKIYGAAKVGFYRG